MRQLEQRMATPAIESMAFGIDRLVADIRLMIGKWTDSSVDFSSLKALGQNFGRSYFELTSCSRARPRMLGGRHERARQPVLPARSIASVIIRRARLASPQLSILTHLPGSRSL